VGVEREISDKVADIARVSKKLNLRLQIIAEETAFSSEPFRTSDRIPYKAHRNSNIANAEAPRVVRVKMYEPLVFIL
jgi:hypothetical protein